MSTSHTPGPYQAHGNAAHTRRGECVAVAYSPADRSHEEACANARLFAAAPELLAMLEKVLAVAEDLTQTGPHILLEIEARELIARARGEV